jgi:hypothetical protein
MTTEGRGIIRFAEKIVQLLDEGGFSATYKYAVLLALMDLCLERSAVDGSPPTSITTPQLAAKIVELYWPHAEPFDDTGVVLRQNNGSQPRRHAPLLPRVADSADAVRQIRAACVPPSLVPLRARRLDDDRAALYIDLVLASATEAARTILKALMASKTYEYQSDFAKAYVAQGEARALLGVLKARGIDVPERVVARITSCTDLAVLDAWLARAMTAKSATDVVGE